MKPKKAFDANKALKSISDDIKAPQQLAEHLLESWFETTQIIKEMYADIKDAKQLQNDLEKIAKGALNLARDLAKLPLQAQRAVEHFAKLPPALQELKIDSLLQALEKGVAWPATFAKNEFERQSKHNVEVLILANLAEVFKAITDKKPGRQINYALHPEPGKPAGAFWLFAEASWQQAFGDTRGLQNLFKVWAREKPEGWDFEAQKRVLKHTW